MPAVKELLNAANCFLFPCVKFRYSSVSRLGRVFYFFHCKNTGELGMRSEPGDIFCPRLYLHRVWLVMKEVAASPQEIVQCMINLLPAYIFDASLPYANDPLKRMFFKSKQESNVWSVACAELSSTKTCKPFTRNDYCRGRIRSRNRAAVLADRCLNFCSEMLYRHPGSSSFQKPGFLLRLNLAFY